LIAFESNLWIVAAHQGRSVAKELPLLLVVTIRGRIHGSRLLLRWRQFAHRAAHRAARGLLHLDLLELTRLLRALRLQLLLLLLTRGNVTV
jgi:hypothetical protein